MVHVYNGEHFLLRLRHHHSRAAGLRDLMTHVRLLGAR